jgi:hypothetical protein
MAAISESRIPHDKEPGTPFEDVSCHLWDYRRWGAMFHVKNQGTSTGFVQKWNLFPYRRIFGFLCFPNIFRQSDQDELNNIIASIHPKVDLQ